MCDTLSVEYIYIADRHALMVGKCDSPDVSPACKYCDVSGHDGVGVKAPIRAVRIEIDRCGVPSVKDESVAL